jgi:hypothetical protein
LHTHALLPRCPALSRRIFASSGGAVPAVHIFRFYCIFATLSPVNLLFLASNARALASVQHTPRHDAPRLRPLNARNTLYWALTRGQSVNQRERSAIFTKLIAQS